MQNLNPVQVQKYLKGVDYPARKDDLIKTAEAEGADQNVRSALDKLPNEEFRTPADVSKALGDIM